MAGGWRLSVAMLAAVSVLTACGSGGEDDDAPDTPATSAPGATTPDVADEPIAAGETGTVSLDDRPFQLHVPDSYDPAGTAALVLVLHGYTSSSSEVEGYFGLTAASDDRGFLLAMPDGTVNSEGQPFWHATDTCCDFNDSNVDDSGYLRAVIDTVVGSYSVDTSRVYIIGHSNGGFMAYRMACDHADVVTAVVSLAGAATDDASQCAPDRPVSVLQIHGTGDEVIAYDGGELMGRPYPSATGTIDLWRELDGCDDQPDESAPALDLDSGRSGEETTVTTYAGGCGEGTRVALWTIDEGRHVPPLTGEATPAILDFLYDHTS